MKAQTAREVTLDCLQIGESATVTAFSNEALGVHFLEMGVVPGEAIKVERVAPMGDPIAVRSSGVLLMMRKAEAATVKIRRLSESEQA
jgi:ferrous iron transport protein A